MSSVTADRDTKPLLPNGGTFLQQHGHHNAQHHPRHLHRPLDSGGASGGMPNEPSSVHMDFVRNEAWLLPSPHLYPRQPKVLHHLPVGPVGHVSHPGHGGHVMHCQPVGQVGHPGHGSHVVHHHTTGYGMMTDAHGAHTLQMMQPQAQAQTQPQSQPQAQAQPLSQPQAQDPPPSKEESTQPPLVEDIL
jgi:hypothetical protein